MKVKKEDYENIYDCIVTDQVPPDVINEYFGDTRTNHTMTLAGLTMVEY